MATGLLEGWEQLTRPCRPCFCPPIVAIKAVYQHNRQHSELLLKSVQWLLSILLIFILFAFPSLHPLILVWFILYWMEVYFSLSERFLQVIFFFLKNWLSNYRKFYFPSVTTNSVAGYTVRVGSCCLSELECLSRSSLLSGVSWLTTVISDGVTLFVWMPSLHFLCFIFPVL